MESETTCFDDPVVEEDSDAESEEMSDEAAEIDDDTREAPEVTADDMQPSWPQLDDFSTVHVPRSTFISVSISPTIRDIDAETVDDILHAIVNLEGASSEGIKKHLSPLALMRLRKLGDRVYTTWQKKDLSCHTWRYRGTDLGIDHQFVREVTRQVKQWFKSKNRRAAFQKVWLQDMVLYLMRHETDITSVNWERCISMVFPLLEMSHLGVGWNSRAIGTYFAGQETISELLKRPKPLVPKRQKEPVFRRGIQKPSEYVDDPVERQLYQEKLREYQESETVYNKKLADLKKWRYGQYYQAAIKRFRTYEITWSAEAGSLKNLYSILAQAWTRLKDKAVNPKVLGRGLSIMFNGVSDERTFGPLTETEARALGPVLTVETLGGIERKTFSIPLMLIKFLPKVRSYLNGRPVFSEGGTLHIYFRKHDTSSDKRQMSKCASIYIKSDGSCLGTRRGEAVMPFLGVWDKQFARVSQTLGKLLGHCVFCRKRMSRQASLTRGSGDTCFKKLGITTGLDHVTGLVLESTTESDVVANVQVDRMAMPATLQRLTETLGDDTEDDTDKTIAATINAVTLLACDGPFVTSRTAPLLQKSATIRDLLADMNGVDPEMNPIVPLPAFIDKRVLRDLSDYVEGKGRREGDLAQIARDLQAYDYLGIYCEEAVEEIGKSIGSALAGQLEGVC